VRLNTNSAPRLLNSWKEIASYLDRGVRTVQRWERELGLPVHRVGTGKRSPVFAVVTELNFWVSTTAAARNGEAPRPQLVRVPVAGPKIAQESKRLLSNMHELARNLAEASVRQHREAELLQKRILEIRARMK
jgi:hypothetical protein